LEGAWSIPSSDHVHPGDTCFILPQQESLSRRLGIT
jgi:hypothetical protein